MLMLRAPIGIAPVGLTELAWRLSMAPNTLVI